MSQTPLFIDLSALFKAKLKRPFCRHPSGEVINYADFLQHALSLSEQLPTKPYALNLCQNRYLFMVAYLAVFLRQQITLLPANQAPKTLENLQVAYQESYCINDDFVKRFDLSRASQQHFPLFNSYQAISISFTSGSTGEPKAIVKTWAEFQQAAELAIDALNLKNQTATLVSTVPPQHMYGLETSLFWVLFSDLTIYSERPFYPEDIRLTLQKIPEPLLISTPTHLKSCVSHQGDWQKMALILSSTAPLSLALAQQIEQRFSTPVQEIYGSTETLSFATRRVCVNSLWKPYQGIQLYQENQHVFVSGGHLSEAVYLDDTFEISDSGLFANLGRMSDLLKIGGKRASLSDLNRLLNQLSCVEDGVFFKTDHERLGAIVVSQASKNAIIAALKPALDAVFLPRVLYFVSKLPRNDTGKIIQSDLETLITNVKLIERALPFKSQLRG